LYKIGITGGIGSGKSTVCAIFRTLGIAVFDADTEAKKLYDEDNELKKTIVQLFGEHVYTEGIFNRKKMAELVFHSPEKLKQLNMLMHPLVQLQFQDWIDKQHGPYVLKEAALLIESGSYHQLDTLMLVSAPLDIRINRVMKRDHVSEEEVLQRIRKQLPVKEKRSFCQYEIFNDDKHLLIPQVLELHNEFLRYAATSGNHKFKNGFA